MSDKIKILRLADTRRATPGMCACCDAEAIGWQRSGRTDTDADGLTIAWRYCPEHEIAAADAARRITIADLASMVPPSRRAARAESAARRAARLLGVSEEHLRASADLAGASSATHTHALIGGMRRMEAEALIALSRALS